MGENRWVAMVTATSRLFRNTWAPISLSSHYKYRVILPAYHLQVYNLNKDNQAEGGKWLPVECYSEILSLIMNSRVSHLCFTIALTSPINKFVFSVFCQWSSWMWQGSTWWKNSFTQSRLEVRSSFIPSWLLTQKIKILAYSCIVNL